ncbi:hypothetical protein AB0F45_15035 [Streptomyces achromogenes]|uniref:hypothetical protein n=1 Tax=Streptomyces achromogenes TaxID=67255 RepID=UPI0033CBC50B
MAVQTRTDTFAALRACFAADLAALIEVPVPRDATPDVFIDLVEEVRDILRSSSLGTWQDASEDLDRAADCLTDALTSPDADQGSLLARARTHLRDAIATAS